MANNKGQMNDEIFRQFIKEDKWIREISHAVGCYDKNHNFKHYRTVSYPDEYIVTKEQIADAKKHYQRRHDEELAGIKKGELVFVAMGCDYQSKYENAVNNHRMRCNFRDASGHRYFIEFCQCENHWEKVVGKDSPVNTKGDWFFIDFSIDIEIRDELDREREELYEFNKGKDYRDQDHTVVPQLEYNAKGVEKKSFKIPFTWDNVLKFVNETYGCNYTSARLLRYFVNCDEYICEC